MRKKISGLLGFTIAIVSLFYGTEAFAQGNVTPDSVYVVADKMPEFPGGDKALFEFIQKQVKYPEDARKNKEHGKVVVQFVIEKTGKVRDAKVLRGVSTALDAEAIRVINLLPDWIPAETNGQKLSMYKVIPVMFQYVSEEDAWDISAKTLVILDGVKMPIGFKTSVLNPSKLTNAQVLKPFPEQEKDRLKKLYGKEAENGVVILKTNKDDIYYAVNDTNSIPKNCKDTVILPQFDGGKEKMFAFIADSIQYPFVAKQLKTQGKVMVRFLVDKSGKIIETELAAKLDYYLDKEALRVIGLMPDWKPATMCGQTLPMWVTVPVIFKLTEPTTEKKWERNDKTVVLMDGIRMPASFDLNVLNYTVLNSYKVLQPGDKETNKKLVAQYGKDAINGVVLIETVKEEAESEQKK